MKKEPTVFGKTKSELGLILESISNYTDKNHPSNNKSYNSLKFLEKNMELLSKNDDAKNTFGVNF